MTRRLPLFAALACVATFVVGAPSSAAVRGASPQLGDSHLFDTWTGYGGGRYMEAVVSADFNGDGKPDAAWARNDFFQNSIRVQLNLGDGTLGAPVALPAQAVSNDIAAGDLDGNGTTDLVVVGEGNDLANSVVDVYLNDGTGVFTHRTATGGQGARRVVLADLSGDGKLDVALTDYWGSSADIAVLLGRGDGTFRAQKRYPVGTQPQGIAAADLDGDGRLDLAVARLDQQGNLVDQVVLLHNDGNGVFSTAKTLTLGIAAGDPVVAAADFDGDGKPDLAVGAVGTDQIAVLHNDGALAFTESLVHSNFTSFNLRAVDVDGDGRIDLLSPSYVSDSGELAFLRNSGGGAFAAPITIESGRNPHDVDAADYNGDGRLDLVTANRLTDTGSVHPQLAGGSFAAPPINRSTAGLPLSTASADFNGDGKIDVAEGGDGSVHVLLNSGGGKLTEKSTIPGCTTCNPIETPYVRYLTASDLNNDGAPDLVWAPDASPYPYVYSLNSGSGTFGPTHEVAIATCGTGAATTADVDNDGLQDILVPNNRSGPSAFCMSVDHSVRVAINNGDGTFQTDYGVDVEPLPEMAVGTDLNGDGKTDLVTGSIQIAVRLGTGGGAFAPAVFSNARATRLKAVDVNADGHTDVATADLSTSTAYVLRNDGSGALSQIASYTGEQISGYADDFALDLGDLDGDGILDLVVANPSGNNVGVHFGTGGGMFAAEQLRYGTHGCLTDVRVADMNGDGKPDLVGPACVGSSFVTPRGVTVLLNKRPATATGAIAGRVKDRATGIAIAGATVDCGAAGVAATGSTGRYRIGAVPPAGYTCTASATGHRPLSKPVTVTAGQTATATFALKTA